MKRKFTLRFLSSILVLVLTIQGFAQVTGDFQTKNVTGNWSDFNAWNIYNGASWQAAIAGQIPTGATSVFVQAAQTINVDNVNAVCNNLNIIGATSSKVAFTMATSVLNVKGNMSLFSTAHNCFGLWTTGAKIVFSGSVQTLSNISLNTIFTNIEVNSSGSVTTTDNQNFEFGAFTLTSGNFIIGRAAQVQGNSNAATITINGGIWTQNNSNTRLDFNNTTSPIGAVTINGGIMILGTTGTTIGFQFSSLVVTNSGVLTVQNFSAPFNISTSINIDATGKFNTALTTTTLPASVTFNGVVNYNNNGNQNISQATYSYLKLSGTGTKTLAAGTTTIPASGTLEMSGMATSPALSLGNGTLAVSNSATNLLYTSAGSQTAGSSEWDTNFQNITVNNVAGVSMSGLSRTILGSLNLTNGTLDIGAGGALTLDGANLNRINGYISGTSTSDVTITGATGGVVLLPLSTDINLRNITVNGTRTVQMDGSNNINLYGTFSIGSTAIYDNGGESDIYKGTLSTPSIIISGKFITKDIMGFYANNAAIDNGIGLPIINATSVIEYGLLGDQAVQGATISYYNVTFSGSGVKTLASATAPKGTVYITGDAILQAGVHAFGDNGTIPFTNFTMDGGRLIMSGTNNPQPQMSGTYNLTAGIVEFACPNSSGQTIRNQTYFGIEVTGAYVGNSLGNINLAPGGFFTVKTDGMFTINADQITGSTGSQTVTIESGAIFKCGNVDGFSGGDGSVGNSTSIKSDIETITLAGGSLVDYSRNNIQVITNQIPYQDLTISGSGTKTAPSGTLIVKGNLTKSGISTFAHNGGTVLLDGADQTFAGLTYNNLILSSYIKTTSGNSTIIDSIKINNVTQLSISAGDSITLQSDALKTARVGQIGDGTINYNSTGKFVVERFINTGSVGSTHGKSWQLLAVPTYSTQTIKDAWQEGATATNVSLPSAGSAGNPKGGYGTMLTSNVANAASQISPGFDAYTPPGTSIKVYNSVTDGYDGPASTGVLIDNPKGYFILVRGDRSVTTYNGTATATRLRTAGQLYTPDPMQQQPPSATVGATQFESVGNPYASAIDLRSLSFGTGINSTVIVWDPTIGGSFGLGAFQALYLDGDGTNNGTNNYVNLITSPAYGSAGTPHNYIQSGQAFIIQGISPSGGTLNFKESDKASNSNTVLLTPEAPQQDIQQLRANLYEVETGGSRYLADGVLVDYNKEYINILDAMDVRKMNNTAENLSLQSGGRNLAIERRGPVACPDTILFNLSGINMQPYLLEFVATGMGKMGIDAFLEDNYLHTRYPVGLEATTTRDFVVNADAASSAAGRFRIVFQAAQGPLPLKVTNLKAYTKNEDIVVEWTVEDETGMKAYQVEKSVDGTGFMQADAVIANNNELSNNYSWLDGQPVAGYNYYRIKSIGVSGQVQYSKVVKVWEGTSKNGIAVYPNPSRNGRIHLLFNNQPAGQYGIRLFNKWGQVILSKEIQHANVSRSSEEVQIDVYAAHGIYRLEVIKPGGNHKNINVVH